MNRGIVLFTVMASRIYTAAVTTVASRRQNLLLKRLRSTAARDTDVLTGPVLSTVTALMQVVAILTVLAMPYHRRSPDFDLGVAP